MRPNDVAQALDLDRIAKDHVWKVEPSCATSGEGKQRIHSTRKSSSFRTRILTRFRQASSKVSPGSARTSRSRRSKSGDQTPCFLHPTTRRTTIPSPHREAAALYHCAGAHCSQSSPTTTPNRPHTTNSVSQTGYPPNLAQAQQDTKNQGKRRGSERERERKNYTPKNARDRDREMFVH